MNDVLNQEPERVFSRKFSLVGMKRKCSTENKSEQWPEEVKLGRFEHSKERETNKGKAKFCMHLSSLVVIIWPS